MSNNANTDFGNNYVTVKLCVPGYYTGLTVKYNGNGDQPIVLGCDYDSFKDVTVITFKTNHFSEFSVKGTKDSATRVADEAGLRAALNADIAKIQLQKDIVVSSTVSVKSTVTLDLNNNRFTMSGPYIAIDVISGGKLTITGGGFVDGGSRGNNMAVRACDGGEVIINNGTFTVGADANGIGNSVIESNGGKIIVNGGHFYTDYNYEGFYYVLNQKNNNPGTITVNGGTFVDYDPSKGDDNLGGNFVADGYSVTSEKKDNKTIYTVVPAVAEVVVPADDEYYYASLEEAFEQASRKSTGENCVTINVLKDCNGNGIVVPESSNICVNFNGHTYTMDGSMVGSPNTQTLAFQLLKDSGIVFKNGKLVTKNPECRMLIQNYCNLTLDNMTIDGKNIVAECYTLSNNNGTILIKDTTIIPPENGVAFDVYGKFGNYSGPSVTVSGKSNISGVIEVDTSTGSGSVQTLTIENEVVFSELNIKNVIDGASIKVHKDVYDTDKIRVSASGYAFILNGDYYIFTKSA